MKKFIFLLIVIFLSLNNYAIAAKNNWAADTDSAKTGDGTGSGSSVGTPGNAFDEDDSTVYYWIGRDFGIGDEITVTATCWVQSEFASTQDIDKMVTIVKAYIPASGTRTLTYTLEAYYDSAWHTIGSGSLTNMKKTLKTFNNLALTGVTKVKVSISSSITTTTTGWIYCYAYAYELYAYEFYDKGVRIRDGAATISIGCKSDYTSYKLRVQKYSTTYGIPLVATDNAVASPVRIYDGSNVKALPKIIN